MQKAEKEKLADSNSSRLGGQESRDFPKSSLRNELKKIRAENPRLFKALSLDRFN